jgi:hypothetical protein
MFCNKKRSLISAILLLPSTTGADPFSTEKVFIVVEGEVVLKDLADAFTYCCWDLSMLSIWSIQENSSAHPHSFRKY